MFSFWDVFVPMSLQQFEQHVTELRHRRWQCEHGKQGAVDCDRTLGEFATSTKGESLATTTRNTGLTHSPLSDIPPPSEVHLDYVDVIVPERLERVIPQFATYFGETWSEAGWKSTGGTSFGPAGSEARCRSGVTKTLVTFKGTACAEIGTIRIVNWLMKMKERYGITLRVRRIDVALDDVQRLYSPREVHDRIWISSTTDDGAPTGHWRPGVVTSAKSYKWCSSCTQGNIEGDTLYVGSDHADRQLAVYDASIRHPDRPPAIRWELRCRKSWAESVVADILRTPGDLGGVFSAHLVGFLDVRDPESYGAKHPERRKRYEWYEKIVGAGTKAAPRPARKRNAVKVIECDAKQIKRRLKRYYFAHDESVEAVLELLTRLRLRPTRCIAAAARPQGRGLRPS